MRILQFLTQSDGGPADHVADLAPELARLGNTVRVISPAGTAIARVAAQGVEWTPLAVRSFRDLSGITETVRTIHNWHPDVIHCQDRRSGLVGRMIGRLTGTPTVYTLHGAPDGLAHLVPNNARTAGERRRDRAMYLYGEKLLALMSRCRVVVASVALSVYAERAIGLPREIIDHVPNGIALKRFAAATPRDGFNVVWLGVMVPVKRLDLLIDALKLAPQVIVTLVGNGPLYEQIVDRAARVGVARRVRFVGFQDEPAVWLASAHVAVLCSDAENCPLSLIQAMASGCAVVATAVGGVPEIIRHGKEGLLVGPGDPLALAQALDRLRGDRDLRESLAAAATARAEEYNVEAMARKLMLTYEKAVEGPAGTSWSASQSGR